ncbi:MAG: hypothetical protein GXN92_01745, partial [Candidatus Micrarchaeota archaeon]|nr:hypothetical protein [Candidatus Micrarchaeota archaeon]
KWMRFNGEASFNKRAQEGWKNSIGELVFSDSALGRVWYNTSERGTIAYLTPGFVAAGVYDWRGDVIDAITPTADKEKIVGFFEHLIEPLSKGTETPPQQTTQQEEQPKQETQPKEEERQLQLDLRGEGAKFFGNGATVMAKVDGLQQGDKLLWAALQDREDGRWILVPGDFITIGGKTYQLTSPYLGELIGNDLVIYVKDGKVLSKAEPGARTITIRLTDFSPTYKEKLNELNNYLGGVFEGEIKWTLPIHGFTRTYSVVSDGEKVISNLAHHDIQVMIPIVEPGSRERQKVDGIIYPSPVNVSVKDSNGAPVEATIPRVGQITTFTTQSGIEYVIHMPHKNILKVENTTYQIDKDVVALGVLDKE